MTGPEPLHLVASVLLLLGPCLVFYQSVYVWLTARAVSVASAARGDIDVAHGDMVADAAFPQATTDCCGAAVRVQYSYIFAAESLPPAALHRRVHRPRHVGFRV